MARTEIKKYKPSVDKRQLLILASLVWLFAGGMLTGKGIYFLVFESHKVVPELVISLIIGLVFYKVLFSRISMKHINRIFSISVSRPCLFSFFDVKGYVMMSVMIVGGITLRKLDIINHKVLFSFYVAMGIPLLFSAFRFYFYWIKYNDIIAASMKDVK